MVVEPESKQAKMIDNYESRLGKFLNEREFKFIMAKLKSKEFLNGNLFKQNKIKLELH